MESRELIDRIYYLREKADNNKLAVFVGAGVSCNVQGMPSWAELVAKMAKKVGYVKCNNCRRKFGSTLSELYKIKNIAMTQYAFYFANSLFLPGFQDPKIFMKPYIEAIICANSETIRATKKFAVISIVGEKYNIQIEDIDIISKFTSPKELSLLLNDYASQINY